MTTVTVAVTAQGQVTFERDVLRHLGLRPGDRIRLALLPDGRAELTAEAAAGSWRHLHGMLGGKGNGARCSIEDIDAAVAEAGAIAGMAGLDRP